MLSQYSKQAQEAAKWALEQVPWANAAAGAVLENEIHRYLENQGFDPQGDEIFKIGDEALSVAGILLGLSPDLLQEAITLDIEVGDIILGGKYKNKRIEVKEIGTDDIGQPTINGKPLLKFRIEKQLPDSKKSKKTLDAEKDVKEEAQDK